MLEFAKYMYVTGAILCGLLLPGSSVARPLVYPNRFSFQKTTPSTTVAPLIYNSITTGESENPSRFRYDTALWVILIGVLVLLFILCFVLYSKKKHFCDIPDHENVSSCYHFPPDLVNQSEKNDVEAAVIIISEAQENPILNPILNSPKEV